MYGNCHKCSENKFCAFDPFAVWTSAYCSLKQLGICEKWSSEGCKHRFKPGCMKRDLKSSSKTMHLNAEARRPLKPHKLQSVVSTVGLCPGSIPIGSRSTAFFPDSIPRVLGHTLASQLTFGWSGFGEPLGLPSWVAFGSCLILPSTFLSGSVSSFVREQKHPTRASPQVLCGRSAGGLGHVIHVNLWIGPYVLHNMFWEYVSC